MNGTLANSNHSRAAAISGDARRSDQLDAGAVGSVSCVGSETEGLRSTTKAEGTENRGSSPTVKEGSKGERSEESYAFETGLKVLKVLECLEGRNFEPVTIERAMQRSGFNYSFTRSALITLKRAGWAKELIGTKERQFVLGPKAENLARSLTGHMLKQ
jgi:hypothetical protein